MTNTSTVVAQAPNQTDEQESVGDTADDDTPGIQDLDDGDSEENKLPDGNVNTTTRLAQKRKAQYRQCEAARYECLVPSASGWALQLAASL